MLLCETNHVLESDYSEVIVVGADGCDSSIPVSGTNEKINQMLMERHLIKMARDADLTRITLKDRENVQKMLMYSLHSHLKNLY